MGREFIQCENRSFITCALLTSSPSIEVSGGEVWMGGGYFSPGLTTFWSVTVLPYCFLLMDNPLFNCQCGGGGGGGTISKLSALRLVAVILHYEIKIFTKNRGTPHFSAATIIIVTSTHIKGNTGRLPPTMQLRPPSQQYIYSDGLLCYMLDFLKIIFI